MDSFKRGETPTFTLTVNGPSVATLGTPQVSIFQQDVTIELDATVDVPANKVVCTMTKEQSARLVAGIETFIQQKWTDDDGNVVVMPEHELEIEDAFIIPEEDPLSFLEEDEPDIVDDGEEIEEEEFDDTGEVIEDEEEGGE